MPSFRPARRRLTVRALALVAALFALDFAGIARVQNGPGQPQNVRVIRLLGVPDDPDERDAIAWGLDPVREVVRPIAWAALMLLTVGSILLYLPRPIDRVLVGIMAVVLLVG